MKYVCRKGSSVGKSETPPRNLIRTLGLLEQATNSVVENLYKRFPPEPSSVETSSVEPSSDQPSFKVKL